MSLAIYPGSFDPITYGHLNLIKRALKIFDNLIVAVAVNVRKKELFNAEERVQMIQQSIDTDRIEVDSFSGLLVDYAHRRHASVILRGLRAISDFEFEFQLAHMNRRLGKSHPEGLDTVFMMTGEELFYVSSHLVREIAQFKGSIEGLVPPHVTAQLARKFHGEEEKH